MITFVLATFLTTYTPKPPPPTEIHTVRIVHIKPPEPLNAVAPAEQPEVAPIVPAAPVHPSSENLYPVGQCTQYVKTKRPDVPNTWGDATDWLYNARADGWETGSTPRTGAIGWVYGHVVYVEAVQGDTITISERNYDYQGSYRVREASASEFSYIY